MSAAGSTGKSIWSDRDHVIANLFLDDNYGHPLIIIYRQCIHYLQGSILPERGAGVCHQKNSVI